MVKMLVNSKIETTWKKWRPYSVELSRQGYDTRKFVVRGPMLVVVRVTAASDLIERCAEVVDAAATNELEDCSLTYLSGSAAESKLAASVKSRATPYAGLFDPSTNACLFAGSGSLGLLVSVINGVASRISHAQVGFQRMRQQFNEWGTIPRSLLAVMEQARRPQFANC
jgi:hypothetical protein